MEDYKDIMIDIETMGVKPYSAIVSIAAVEFDMLTGETGEGLYEGVCLQSCVDLGLGIDAQTAIWWINQGEEAKYIFSEDYPTRRLTSALESLRVYLQERPDHNIWANSPAFDLNRLKEAYEKCGFYAPPWDYWKERDLRTMAYLAPKVPKDYDLEQHDALNDCYNQINWLCRMYAEIKKLD